MVNRKKRIKNGVKEILEKNISPFWLQYSVDRVNGGFYGLISDDNIAGESDDKGLVMTARMLWSFSALFGLYSSPQYKEMADHALDFLQNKLKDVQNGGYFWSCDVKGDKKEGQKVIYGEAFALYGLCEYYSQWPSDELAQKIHSLFSLLEEKARDSEFGGYWEGCDDQWNPQFNYCLSDEDRQCAKSMNTHLHVLEAYTQYLRLFPESESARDAVTALIHIHFKHIQDSSSGHLSLFFDKDWNRKDHIRSYGHDIEASWLLWEAIEILGDKSVEDEYKERVLSLLRISLEGVKTVYEDHRELDQAYMVNEFNEGHLDETRVWWVQAETLVGLVNGWQLSGDEKYLERAESVFNFIKERQLNPLGEWFGSVGDNNLPITGLSKGGFWKTPYHNSRACMEVLRRLK